MRTAGILRQKLQKAAGMIFCLFFLAVPVGCSLATQMEEIEFKPPGEQIPIRITAGDKKLEGYLYENGTAQTFAGLLPLTAELWTPADYARAFQLNVRIPDEDASGQEYERGCLGYWYNGPSIAILYGEEQEQTDVEIVKIGKITDSDLSVLEDYIGSITIDRTDL